MVTARLRGPGFLFLAVLTALAIPHDAVGQSSVAGYPIFADAGETICTLPVVLHDRNLRLVPQASSTKTAAAASTISVTYVHQGEAWPAAAQAAFNHAAEIWERAVTSSVTIEVEANWANLGGCSAGPISLGSAGAVNRWRDAGSFPQSGTWYVDALADAFAGTDLCSAGASPPCAGQPDITASFNRECDDPGSAVTWYFGTDGNTPAGQTDFVTVVLHELGHGLGFAGAGNVSGGGGTVLRLGYPSSYDHFAEDGLGSSLVLDYTDASVELKAALEGDSSGVFFNATNANAANGGSPPRLYAPSTWQGGSSYSHLNESTFNATTNALMTPQLSTAEALHVLGNVTCGLFKDIGWTMAAADCDVALPVELTAFTSNTDGRDILLSWETLSERNNAGFEIHLQSGQEPFRTVGFVDGAGTTSEAASYSYRLLEAPVGINRIRLAQVDFDGAVQFLDEVEIVVELGTSFELTDAYPNPFNPRAQFYVTALKTQTATVEVFDATGRRTAILFDGVLQANSPTKMVVDGSAWPSGLYLYRVTADEFSSTGKLVLLK